MAVVITVLVVVVGAVVRAVLLPGPLHAREGGRGDVGRRLGELERRQADDIAGARDEIRGIGGPR